MAKPACHLSGVGVATSICRVGHIQLESKSVLVSCLKAFLAIFWAGPIHIPFPWFWRQHLRGIPGDQSNQVTYTNEWSSCINWILCMVFGRDKIGKHTILYDQPVSNCQISSIVRSIVNHCLILAGSLLPPRKSCTGCNKHLPSQETLQVLCHQTGRDGSWH